MSIYREGQVGHGVRGTWASLGGAGEVLGRAVVPDLATDGRRNGSGVSLARGGVLELDRVAAMGCRAVVLGGAAA
jgi:hypothetical protein